MPFEYPKGYCFRGGRDVNFIMVDWFKPYPTMLFPIDIYESKDEALNGLTPLDKCPNKEIELTPELREKFNSMLCEFIRKKNYNDGHDLLAITAYGDSFVVKV